MLGFSMARDRTATVFGAILRESRINAGLTQEKLALEADLDRSYISELENGRKHPSLETILKVAPVLKLTAEAMVARTRSRLPTVQGHS